MSEKSGFQILCDWANGIFWVFAALLFGGGLTYSCVEDFKKPKGTVSFGTWTEPLSAPFIQGNEECIALEVNQGKLVDGVPWKGHSIRVATFVKCQKRD